jgi:hypothetical protein
VSFRISYEGGEAVIRVDGLFDAEAAAKLRAILRAESALPAPSAIIDFNKARDISDIALAALVELALPGAPVQVRMRGLAARHSRMMRLLADSRREPQAVETPPAQDE